MSGPEPYFSDDMVQLHLGDCLDVLAGMEPGSVDAVVCDPPYGLEFMGREWDTFTPAKARIRTRRDVRTNPAEGKSVTSTPESYTAGRPFQSWCESWAAECLRILKPGGWLLAFGGTRTWHRLVSGIEDAGFEVRDSVADLTGYDAPGLMWVYGSGFPKSLDVSKAIDALAGADREVIGASPDSHNRVAPSWQAEDGKPHGMVGRPEGPRLVTAPATADAARWEGWGTALKPAWEPIAVGRKQLAGTVARNVLEHGTGALNIDGCRIPVTDPDYARNASGDRGHGDDRGRVMDFGMTAGHAHDAGRWPPNVLLSEEAAAEMDRQSGITVSRGGSRGAGGQHGAFSPIGAQPDFKPGLGDTGGASRFFPVFRYEAKASASERPRSEDGAAHPTVKPLDLMAWLVRLVTPPGGLVLDPFAGSGTTAEACVIEGFRCVLVEKDPTYAELIKTRLSKPIQPTMFGLEAS